MDSHTVHTNSLCQGKACEEVAKASVTDPKEPSTNQYGVTPISVRANERLKVLRNRFDKGLGEYSVAQTSYTEAVLGGTSKSVRDKLKTQIGSLNSQLLETAGEINASMEAIAKLDADMDVATAKQRELLTKKIAQLNEERGRTARRSESLAGGYQDSVLRVRSLRYRYTLWLIGALLIGFHYCTPSTKLIWFFTERCF